MLKTLTPWGKRISKFIHLNIQGTRRKIQQHLETFRVNHELLLLSTVKNLKEMNTKKDFEIKQLQKLNIEKDESLQELKHDITDLKDQLKNVRTQLKDRMENNQAQANYRFEEIEENLTQQKIKSDRIDNLQTFAERTSKLQSILSNQILCRNDSFTLFKNEYDKSEEVAKWNEIVDEANGNDNEKNRCDYLKTLTASINLYTQIIYSHAYEKRLWNLCHTLPEGVTTDNFIKIGCYKKTKSICIKGYKEFQDFYKEIDRNDVKKMCKIQNNPAVCSYYFGGYLHIVLYLDVFDKIYLLHNSKEGNKLHLPIHQIVNLGNIWEYLVNDSIILFKTW